MSPIRIAVATAIASVAATSANALDISTFGSNPNQVNVYVSGSTAVDNTLLNVEIATDTPPAGVPSGLCQANTIDVYQVGSPSQRLTFCAATAVGGVAAGTPIAIFKESTAGSINGVQPLINQSKSLATGVVFFNPAGQTDAACAAGVGTQQPPATAYSAYTLHANCTFPTAAHVITGGVADVEGTLLRLQGGGAVNPNDISGLLTGAPGLDVVWGVPVTKNLYYALQTAEGLTSHCPAPGTGTFLDSPACAPSLSMEQVASLYAATGLVTWNQIDGLNNPSGDNNVYICRRDIGSGTEASFEAYFLGARCSISDELMAAEDGQFVFASASTGNVRNCLQAFFSGGTITPYNQNTIPPTTFGAVHEPGNQWAIGILSSEVSAANLSGTGDAFRMIAVDGVLPTLDNTSNGFWRYFSTDVFYKVKSGNGIPSGGPLDEFNALQARIGHPGFTSITNSGFAGRPWGNGGDLAPASLFGPGPDPATAANIGTNPINSFGKVTGALLSPTATVNNCDTPVLINNGGTDTTPPPSILLGNGNVNN